PPPPSLILMTSFARDLYRGLVPNSTGITYEIPAVSVFVRLRGLTGRPLTSAGVLYRPFLRGFVEHQQKLSRGEGIEFDAIEVSKEPSRREVITALKELERREVNAIWVLNDNGLLTGDLVRGAWLPQTD